MREMFKRIVVAYDGSEGAKKALEAAIELAASHRAELIGLAIESHLPHYAATVGEVDEELRVELRQAEALLREAAERAKSRGVDLRREVRAGHSAQAIIEAAKEHSADVIVIGHSGYSGVWGRFLGTTTEKVSRHAACSVLIVR